MCDIEKQDSLSQVEKMVASPHEILIDSDGEGGFIASIPSLPGCLSCGETQDEAIENVMDAKRAWIAAALEDGIAIPDPVKPGRIERGTMMYAFLTLDDGTQIVHSGMRSDNTVRVHVERPDAEHGFLSASCILPQCVWQEVCGFTDEEIARYDELIRSAAHLILQYAQVGAFHGSTHF